MGHAIPSFRPGMGTTAFAKLQPSCQWFITVSTGRSETDSGTDLCGSGNEIRQINATLWSQTRFATDVLLLLYSVSAILSIKALSKYELQANSTQPPALYGMVK